MSTNMLCGKPVSRSTVFNLLLEVYVHSTCLEKLLFTKWKRIMLIVSIMLYKDRGFFAIDGRTIINIYIHAYLFIS